MKIEELVTIEEAAKRAFKRSNNKVKRYFRCTTGPKAGMLVASPEQCGKRKDPKKVRVAKRTARLTKGVRIRKNKIAKRAAISRLVTRLNQQFKKD